MEFIGLFSSEGYQLKNTAKSLVKYPHLLVDGKHEYFCFDNDSVVLLEIFTNGQMGRRK
ncbi:MAG: hypothetical protein IPN68_18185 [Bacteroidetes bacterium]|nr:hypothetical protein [Bacteroidota bacterium]